MADIMEAGEKAAQLVFPGFKFGLDDPADALLLAELGVGGFCLYGGDVQEVADFTARLEKRAARPLLFCADYEDGVFSQCPSATPLSSNMGLGASGSETLAFEKGALTGIEARAMGVRWVLSPVCDLARRASNPIVNVRSFSSDPAVVARLARAYIRGLKSEGVLSCLKHFPGHGETVKDSHLELPVVPLSRQELLQRDLVPFQALTSEADAVMTGHLKVPSLDQGLPYSLSADVRKTLRQELGFAGLVSTDALNMQAIAQNYEEQDAAERALLGGSDILLVPSGPKELVRGLIAAMAEKAELLAAITESYDRLERARETIGLGASPARKDDLPLVGGSKHRELAERMAESCLAWPREPVEPLTGKVCYWEIEADTPEEWLGSRFVTILRESGVLVDAFQGSAPSADVTLVLGCFLSPRAYTGRIEYDPQERARIDRALSRFKRSLIVSFGSPFVFEVFKAPGLCAFSRNEPAQRAAALALTGRLEVHGRMPVTLR